MLRRAPFALPHADHLSALIAVLDGEAPVEPADPAGFLDATVAHRVVGAAVAALGEGRLSLPDDVSRALRDAQAVAALRSALMRSELAALAEPLADAIAESPIVLKGPAIADRFYPDPGLRSFADLDLLIPRGRLGEAVEALGGLSYEERVELRPGFGATHGHDVHMARRLGPRRADVELHWRVGDDALGEALSHRALIGPSVPAGQPAAARYTSPSDQLLVCSMHLLSDRLKRLVWIEDIRRIASALNDEAWAGAFERARELGQLWVLHRALDYAAHHLGYRRDRQLPAGEPPRWGPVRAVEELDLGASLHLGRLAAMPWRQRPVYLRDVLLPSHEGLEGTVGGDGAGRIRLAARHFGRALRGVGPRR